MFTRLTASVLLCSLANAAPAVSDNGAGPSWTPAFERISIEQGLSQSVVTAIHQDELGFMWFGTQEGLNRFDGRRFQVYRHDPDDASTLSSSSIEAIAGDSLGRLWLGTDDGGLNVLDPRTGEVRVLRRHSDGSTGLSHDRVLDLAFGPDGHAWLATEGGLDRVTPGGWEVKRAVAADDDGVPVGAAYTAVVVDGDGRVWGGTRESGLVVHAGSRTEHLHDASPGKRRLSGNRVTDLALGPDGEVWVTTLDGGLDAVAADTVRSLRESAAWQAMPDSRLTAVRIRPDGTLMLGTEGGYLYRIDRDMRLLGVHHHVSGDPDSVARGAVMDLFVDRTGVIWVGSYTGGISKSKSLSGHVTHGIIGPHDADRLPDRSVRCFWIDRDGSAWVGTDGGLARAERGADAYSIYRHDPGDAGSISDNRIYALLRRTNGELWVGTEDGLNRYLPGSDSFATYLAADGSGLPDDRVRDLVEDRQGRLWVATEGGLARYDDANDRFLPFGASLSSDEITTLHVDGRGSLWVGTNDAGLNRVRLEDGEVTHFPAGRGELSHHSVWSVQRVGDSVWVGTFSGGLNRIDLSDGSIEHFLEADGLVNNVVYQIVPDKRGRLWLTTNAGVSVLEPESGRFLNYNPRDGLRNYEYNSNASFRDGQGRIWLGGINGMDIVDADSVLPSDAPAPAALTGFELFNRPVSLTESSHGIELDASVEYASRLQLGYRADVFSIGLAALHFVNPDANSIRYRLDGLHQDWLVMHASQQYVTFNAVPPGDYTLRVQASARGTRWGPERQLEMRIEPPPWRTPVAFGGYVMLGLLLLFALVRAHWRRLGAERRQVAKLNAMVAERTTALETLNEQLRDTNRQLELATRRDPLTRLANRRELLEWLPREQAAALRAWRDWALRDHRGNPPDHARLCFLALDIDDFKYINDTWGHQAGDEVLEAFAERLQDHCRDSDLAARWGGEEFLLVMRSIGGQGARYLAERIRRAVESRPVVIEKGDSIHITCSIGFAFYPFSSSHPSVGTWEDVIGLADRALYAAKKAGKNAWVGVTCPPRLDADAVRSLLRDPDPVAGESGAEVWRSEEN